ncbi:hypothetical protein Desac_2800 [Desulfobacca acetoxidans DSM 11109]|uniref:Uncharacterized protein n=1 Tax=Desulfobacca acetoxidans (strain ATCC 700848 / DSM 11109 / ASRB2) TaxID=880072 RepID=F2NIR3_DESAR|nr:hypothetical protein Desac_2800 [Desulfobacca acetoxidans DSM 11109]
MMRHHYGDIRTKSDVYLFGSVLVNGGRPIVEAIVWRLNYYGENFCQSGERMTHVIFGAL